MLSNLPKSLWLFLAGLGSVGGSLGPCRNILLLNVTVCPLGPRNHCYVYCHKRFMSWSPEPTLGSCCEIQAVSNADELQERRTGCYWLWGPDGYNEGIREKNISSWKPARDQQREWRQDSAPKFAGGPSPIPALWTLVYVIGIWGLQGIKVELEVEITFHLLHWCPWMFFTK